MCLMLLMCLSLKLAVTSELLLVRCKLACSLACERWRQGLAKGPLGNRTATNNKKNSSCGRTIVWIEKERVRKPRLWLRGHGSAKGRVLCS